MHNKRLGMRLAVLACLGMLGCDGAVQSEGGGSELTQDPALPGFKTDGSVQEERHGPPPLAPVLGTETLLPAATTTSGGGVELKTNLIRGTARFTNQDATILQILANDPWRYGYVAAYSTNPSGFSASTSSVVFANPTEFSFDLLVEAGARGDSGVVYNVSARRGQYTFPTLQNVTVKPPSVQPDPTEVTIEQCVGVVDITFGTDATCKTPASVSYAWVNEFNTYRKSENHYIGYVPGGWNQNVNIHHRISNGSETYDRTNTLALSVGCDTIVPVCIAVPPPPPPLAKGAITGPWEVIGETGLGGRTFWVGDGPNGASPRSIRLDADLASWRPEPMVEDVRPA